MEELEMLLNEQDGGMIAAIPPGRLVELVIVCLYIVGEKASEADRYIYSLQSFSIEVGASNTSCFLPYGGPKLPFFLQAYVHFVCGRVGKKFGKGPFHHPTRAFCSRKEGKRKFG
jgi:hypothetical protein